MNWLQICRRIRKEIGFSGTDTSPSSVLGQGGEMLSIVNWASSAYLAIQAKAKWDWLWERASVTILAGTNLSTGLVAADRYVKDATTDGSRSLAYAAWPDFRAMYPAAQIADGSPSAWTVRPDCAIVVSARPTADLILGVERYRNPLAIGADADSPLMPEHQHEAIVWRAMMFYAGHDEAGALYQHASAEYRRIMGDAAIESMPAFEAGSPLC